MKQTSYTPPLCENNSGTTSSDGSSNSTGGDSDYALLVAENAIIVFGRRGCCMCYVMQRLLLGLGANPTIYDVDEEDEVAVTNQLSQIISCTGDPSAHLPPFPVAFIGGKLFGDLDKVMAAHISGDLVPLLRKAGALWL
ncbi:unnamed protein product [Cuscuta epithymum]|uniref:Glutaredoxin domain-containing protein n=1 Tax=Cuscuta epithymum TaxID=186058 RepID=A0AAV0EHT6_9ASTE|nr:unnamed protein product [Cuscuta epithymum]